MNTKTSVRHPGGQHGFLHVLVAVITAAAVHAAKAGRLYLALYGSDVSISQYIKAYCRAVPASVVIPFKLGEFFRMYCYGVLLGNALKGIVAVLFDRFMDTAALVTMILLAWIFHGGHMAPFVYLLLVFLAFVLLIYSAFPEVYKFWKKYLLKAKATEHKLSALKMLGMLNIVYQETANVSKGRGILLYFISMAAWAVEIGSMAALSGLLGENGLNQKISTYLASAVGRKQSAELEQFIFISVILLIAVHGIVEVHAVYSGAAGRSTGNDDTASFGKKDWK